MQYLGKAFMIFCFVLFFNSITRTPLNVFLPGTNSWVRVWRLSSEIGASTSCLSVHIYTKSKTKNVYTIQNPQVCQANQAYHFNATPDQSLTNSTKLCFLIKKTYFIFKPCTITTNLSVISHEAEKAW